MAHTAGGGGANVRSRIFKYAYGARGNMQNISHFTKKKNDNFDALYKY